MTTEQILQRAREIRDSLLVSTQKKNEALLSIAQAIERNEEKILAANHADVQSARGEISEVMMDRLTLTPQRVRDMAAGVRAVAALPDPVGEVLSRVERPGGLRIEKVRVPLGVVAIIYESRPNVTSDAAALTLKSGNVAILRSGKEAYRSAAAIVAAMRVGLESVGVCPDAIQLIGDTSRQSATQLMEATGYVDLLIPRGGKGLIRACTERAKVPCIETGTGICHVYVDRDADLEMALNIVRNAKTSRPSVCNAEEVLLVDAPIAPEFLPMLRAELTDKRVAAAQVPVQLRTDERAYALIGGTPAQAQDFDTEFLDYILAVAVVDGVEQAVDHIGRHSTHHSDAIVTGNARHAEYFLTHVDSAAVYVNASTRFTDGGEFGLGCEMGISTQKLHARGPMGLAEMTTYKYKVYGNGQTR